jgi:hypothetical protein
MSIENLEVHRLTKIVQNQLGEDFVPESSIKQGIEEAFERNSMRLQMFVKKSQYLKDKGKNPFPCFNCVVPNIYKNLILVKKNFCVMIVYFR